MSFPRTTSKPPLAPLHQTKAIMTCKNPSESTSKFPQLEILNPAHPHTFLSPAKRINDGPDVAHFLASKAYRDIGLFILQLNRALCPRKVFPNHQTEDGAISKISNDSCNIQTFALVHEQSQFPTTITRIQELLAHLDAMIEEAPPFQGSRRFGNISFRKWHALLEESIDNLLSAHLPMDVLNSWTIQDKNSNKGELYGKDTADRPVGPLDELKAYFLGGFGSAQRLDYGTGHELSFVAFLGCLWKLGAFGSSTSEADRPGEMERNVVLGVVEPYLKVIRRLIITYTLEPAGSHGVWGLDDHSFVPYIFGSAQLTRPISEDEPMPLEGSLSDAPNPGDITNSTSVELLRTRNMYFSAIGFINDVKKGPFWEHSPILFDISGIKDGWGKINKGMIKMYNAEVLGKFPVVQHFPFGSLFSWDADQEAAPSAKTAHVAN